MSSLPLISFSLRLSLSLSLTAPLPLCSTYRSISRSSLIQHPPTTLSASMLPPHSALFLPLSLSALISPFLPALPLLSAFLTLPPLVFHFSLIHNKTEFRKRGLQDLFSIPPPFLCIISNHKNGLFAAIFLSLYLSNDA